MSRFGKLPWWEVTLYCEGGLPRRRKRVTVEIQAEDAARAIAIAERSFVPRELTLAEQDATAVATSVPSTVYDIPARDPDRRRA